MSVNAIHGQGLWTIYNLQARITYAGIVFKSLALVRWVAFVVCGFAVLHLGIA